MAWQVKMKRESEKWETKSDKGTERQETELGGRGEEGRVKDRELKQSRWESWVLTHPADA